MRDRQKSSLGSSEKKVMKNEVRGGYYSKLKEMKEMRQPDVICELGPGPGEEAVQGSLVREKCVGPDLLGLHACLGWLAQLSWSNTVEVSVPRCPQAVSWLG